jgi:hypothetical protein
VIASMIDAAESTLPRVFLYSRSLPTGEEGID